MHEATAQGYRLEIHVIGDAAAEAAISAIEAADVARERRPILTHCQVVPMIGFVCRSINRNNKGGIRSTVVVVCCVVN